MTGEAERSIEEIRQTVDRLEDNIENLTRAIYGYAPLSQRGFRDEVQTAISELREEVVVVRNMSETLRRERAEEAAERRGMKRLIGYTGITSLLTLLTLVGTALAILYGGSH